MLVLLDPGVAVGTDDDDVRGRQGTVEDGSSGRRVAVLAPPLVTAAAVSVADAVEAAADEAG